MTRYIDADALDVLTVIGGRMDGKVEFVKAVNEMIQNAPTIDAVPVRNGHWVYDPDGMDWGLPAWKCSECHKNNDMIPTHIRGKDSMIRVTDPLRWAGSKYCPNCGCKMDAERKEK